MNNKQGTFDEHELELVPYQFLIRHCIDDFKIGDYVFIGTGDSPKDDDFCIIIDIFLAGKYWDYDDKKGWFEKDKWQIKLESLKYPKSNRSEFPLPPECVKKYSDFALLEWKRKYKICLN